MQQIYCVAFHDGGAEVFVRRHHNKVFRVAQGSKENFLVGVQVRRAGAATKGLLQKPEEVGDTRVGLGRKVFTVEFFPIRADEKLVRAPRVCVAGKEKITERSRRKRSRDSSRIVGEVVVRGWRQKLRPRPRREVEAKTEKGVYFGRRLFLSTDIVTGHSTGTGKKQR
jgi:hypothetical protein